MRVSSRWERRRATAIAQSQLPWGSPNPRCLVTSQSGVLAYLWKRWGYQVDLKRSRQTSGSRCVLWFRRMNTSPHRVSLPHLPLVHLAAVVSKLHPGPSVIRWRKWTTQARRRHEFQNSQRNTNVNASNGVENTANLIGKGWSFPMKQQSSWTGANFGSGILAVKGLQSRVPSFHAKWCSGVRFARTSPARFRKFQGP